MDLGQLLEGGDEEAGKLEARLPGLNSPEGSPSRDRDRVEHFSTTFQMAASKDRIN